MNKDIHQEKLEQLEKIHQEKSTPKQNNIRYVFYVSEKTVPWRITGSVSVHPLPDFDESYFQFKQINHQFDYLDTFTGRLVTDKDTYTYWKVERYTNNTKDRTLYFFTEGVNRILKNSYELNLTLDVYMTYTRLIINDILYIDKPIHYDRLTISNNILNYSFNYTGFYEFVDRLLKSLSNVDDVISNMETTYKEIQPIPIMNYNSSKNLFPIKCDGLVSSKDGKYNRFNLFEIMKSIVTNFSRDFYSVSEGGLNKVYGSIQIKEGNNTSVKYNSLWWQGRTINDQDYQISEETRRQINNTIDKYVTLKQITFNDKTVTENEFKENLSNSYFIVMRNIDGTVDCYPILGKIECEFSLPILPVNTNNKFTIPNLSQSGQVSNNGSILNRVYCGYDNGVKLLINNDYDSLYKDLVQNVPSGYTNKSFIGIYRGIICNGDSSKLKVVFKSPFTSTQRREIQFLGQTRSVCFPEVERICYKLEYNDFINFEINDGLDKFTLYKPSEPIPFVERYINLLQPVCIGSYEILPVRYIFKTDKTNKSNYSFSIPYTCMFLDSFQLFLRDGLYNNPSFYMDLGSTLPTKTEEYQQQLNIINQQKNNGVFSSVSNMLATPLNWLSGGLTGNLFNNVGYGTSKLTHRGGGDKGWDDWIKVNNLLAGGSGGWKSSEMYDWGSKGGIYGSLNIGSLGSFITSGVNIGNIIRQSEMMKRNLGSGYLTTTTDTIQSSIINQTFTKQYLTKTPSGFCSYGYKKIFDDSTRDTLRNYFNYFGYQMNTLLPSNYIERLLEDIKVNNQKIGFIQLNKDWCNVNLTQLRQFNDVKIKEAVLTQISDGLRISKF